MEETVSTLSNAEEQARELVERRRAELDAAEESARRITEIEQEISLAREEAEAERKRRADHERKLQGQLEDAGKKLDKAQRQLEQAQQRIAEAEERIGDTEQELKLSGEQGSEEREEQAQTSERLRKQLQAEREVHERQQKQHEETEREIAKLQEVLAAERAAAEARIAQAEGTLASLRGEQHHPPQPGQLMPMNDVNDRGSERPTIGGLLGRKGGRPRRQTKGIFVTVPGTCAVCTRSYAAGSDEALAESGWIVHGDVGLCPQCQANRWQMPEGAPMPFRRFSERQTSG